jgi:hypothetical protein
MPTNEPAAADFFVATDGRDSWSGTLAAPNATNSDGPFASVAKAQAVVRSRVKANPSHPLTIMLRDGTYYLPLSPTSPGTLKFTASDSGNSSAPITWRNYPAENPVISGGVPIGSGGLGLTWTNVSGSLWQVKLPQTVQNFEYLFYNGERRLRSRVQSANGVGYYMNGAVCTSTETKKAVDISLCNLGTFLRIADTVPPTGANANCPSANDGGSQSKCLDRFEYNPNDPIAQFINLTPSGGDCGSGAPSAYPVGDIEVNYFAAWSVDVMRIGCIDPSTHVIYLTGATFAPTATSSYDYRGPGKGHRYIVENTRDAFNEAHTAGQTGLWFLDRSTSPWVLNYLANAGENPNSDTVVMAQLQPVIEANESGASLISATNLSYVDFLGIAFEVDNFVPPAAGFNTDENGEATLPSAIDCESCQYVTFDSVIVRHTSASGIQIASTSGNSGPPASNDVVQNSAFYDIGSSPLHIGHTRSSSDKVANVVQFVTFQNNLLQGYGRVFADGEGFAQSNGHHITYLHNDITDGYHAAISVCLTDCPSHLANGSYVVSQYNHIWNTMQGITSDGGTLYYQMGASDGNSVGSAMLNNLVHDTTDSQIIDSNVAGSGYGGEGLYLDAQTGGVDVENNVVYNISAHAAWITDGLGVGGTANTFRNNIFAYAREALFNEGGVWKQGCGTDPLHQDDLINNIFYFDRNDQSNPAFYVTTGCAYSCGADYDQFQTFQGNLYWRTDGAFATYPKAFHVVKSAFADSTTCFNPGNPAASWAFLSFAQWQSASPPPGTNWGPAAMDEDPGGVVTIDPKFGHTGKPTDFLLSSNLVSGFDYTKTNDTILHAGRNNPVITVPPVPETFPTYSYTSF